MSVRAYSIGVLLACCGGVPAAALAQDSVALTPGGNDALSAYEPSTLIIRYAVDAAPFESSWGGLWQIAPVAKASRDLDPLFRTQILGASAVSPTMLSDVTFEATGFPRWQAPGVGVNPAANSAPELPALITGFSAQFSIALSDFSLAPTNIVTATIGLDAENPARLYVTRHAAVSSRANGPAMDTATLSLGSVTASGVTFFRADSFGTDPANTSRITGDNLLSFTPGGSSSVNTLFNSGGTNTAGDTASTAYIVRNETAPHNTPSSLVSGGGGGQAHALIMDTRALFRSGSSTTNISANTTAHRAAGVAGHRGNPSFSPITVLGGNAGTVAAIAKPTTGGISAKVNILAAFGLNATGTTPPSVAAGSARAFTLPSPISDGTFTANTGGAAEFRQYLSQESFRGANGQVGIGTNAGGDLLLAAVATDPAQGEFVALVRYTAPSTSAWSIVARPGSAVLDGPSGAQVGAISATDAAFSAPAIDLLGNVYFTATWQPALGPAGVGLFKAVDVGGAYKLEKIVATGDAFTGANSTRNYTITSIALEDSDSLASGAFHSSSLLQQQRPGATTSDAALSNAAGGLIVNAVITYDNGGTPESYDTVLFVSARVADEPEPCPGDFDGSGEVNATDIFVFLDAWFSQNGQSGAGLSADTDGSGTVDASDIFVYLDVWFTNNGVPCP